VQSYLIKKHYVANRHSPVDTRVPGPLWEYVCYHPTTQLIHTTS